MKEKMIIENCNGCTSCIDVCAFNALSIGQNEKGFYSYLINSQICKQCNKCSRYCKQEINKHKENNIVYACRTCDDDSLFYASSGGVFYEIGKKIINAGGIVYGVVFSDEQEVVHCRGVSIDDIKKMRGSKYVQSKLGDTFQLVRNDLEKGSYVLFTGTPCQIAGLYKYLSKEYSNLLTIDIICHGTPSPRFWSDYIKYLGKDKRIYNVNFRDKQTGWHRFSFSYFVGNVKNIKMFIDDPFCFLFDKHYLLNEACFLCEFAGKTHVADITIGDYWGIEKFNYVEDDNKGYSIVQINSNRGYSVINDCNSLYSIEIPTDCLSNNHTKPALKPDDYDLFWIYYKNEGIKNTLDKYFYGTGVKKIIKLLKINFKTFLIKTKMIKYFI